MYLCYMDGILMPVAPSKINTKINNKNKTITLINEGEINLLKAPGLQEISFEMLIPSMRYPFALYIGTFLPISYYLEVLNLLKTNKKTFRFIIIREGTLGSLGFDTNLKVSLEDYQIIEDANNGRDVVVSIRLKETKEKTSSTIRTITTAGGAAKLLVEKSRETSKVISKTYKVKENDTLFNIARRELGNGEKFRDLLSINNLSNQAEITVGQVIRLE